MGFTTFEEAEIFNCTVEWSGTGDGPSTLTLFSSSLRLRRVDAIMAVNMDSIDHTLQFKCNTGAVYTYLGQVVIPAGTGVGAVPPKDCLTVLAPPQIGAFLFPIDSTFQVAILEAMVDDTLLDVIATVGEF